MDYVTAPPKKAKVAPAPKPTMSFDDLLLKSTVHTLLDMSMKDFSVTFKQGKLTCKDKTLKLIRPTGETELVENGRADVTRIKANIHVVAEMLR